MRKTILKTFDTILFYYNGPVEWSMIIIYSLYSLIRYGINRTIDNIDNINAKIDSLSKYEDLGYEIFITIVSTILYILLYEYYF